MKRICIWASLFVLLLTFAASGQTAPAKTKNNITSLYDSIGKQEKPLVMDWGFAALVNYDGKKILFDTGWDPENLARNVKTLGVDLKDIDVVVISHRHNDHAAGFPYVAEQKPKVVAYLPDDPPFWSAPLTMKEGMMKDLPDAPKEFLSMQGRDHKHNLKAANTFRGSDAKWTDKSQEIMAGVWVIRTVSRVQGDFDGYPPNASDKPKLIGMPELSLAIRGRDGLIIITGCSHSGVDEIVAEAKKVAGQNVDLVFGGFHMQPYDAAQIGEVASKMQALGVKRVAPAHCTGPLGMKVFQQVYAKGFVYGGLGSVIEFD